MQSNNARVKNQRPRHFEGFGGVQLSAICFGNESDPPVLILHNGGRRSSDWHEVASELGESGRYAIALDLRGHGDSERPRDGRYDQEAYRQDLVAVLRSLSARPVILAASMSGLTAILALGEGEQHLARALVLVDTSLTIDEEAGARAVEQLRSNSEFNVDPRIFEGGERAQLAPRLSAAAERLRLPVLIVHGEQSDLFSEADVRRLAGTIPEAEYACIPAAGHYVFVDQPDAFNGVLLDFLERRAPRVPLLFEEGSDPRTLRDALGCFGTGVTVVTTIDQGGQPVGLTANSFTSVSLDPPLILFSLAQFSQNLEVFQSAGRFAVNVLHIGQQPTSDRFARPTENRFEGVDWENWSLGVPILNGSLANFECETYAIHDGGDHDIFVGRVVRARFEAQRDPLLYFRGRYRRIHFQ